MGKVVIKRNQRKVFISKKLTFPESLNEKAYASMELMDGVIPLQKVQKGKQVILCAEIEKCRTLENYLKIGLSKEQFLNIVLQIIDLMKLCKELGVSENNLDLVIDRVFIEDRTQEIRCIFWPITNNEDYIIPSSFFRNIQYEAEFTNGIDLGFVYEYNNFFENKAPFSFKNFERMVMQISGKTIKKERIILGSELEDDIMDKGNEINPSKESNGQIAYQSQGQLNQQVKQSQHRKRIEPISYHVQQNESGREKTSILGKEMNIDYTAVQVSSALVAYILCLKTGVKKTITKGEFVIGKSQDDVDFWIEGNKTVSRCHAKIVNRLGHFFIIDLESLNGTFVNERRIQPKEEIQLLPGDKIRLSDERFIFDLE